MKEVRLSSYAKINLSIDVKGVLTSGMHEVDMVMQQLSFHDNVTVRYKSCLSSSSDGSIVLRTNRSYLPTDERNTAYKAASLMIDRYGGTRLRGMVDIEVFKRVPVSAGLAGGSGNGAAVFHGLNALWDLRLSVRELCELGARIGSDVPFCIMGQAKGNHSLPGYIHDDPLASSCARAQGTGTDMSPVKGLRKFAVIAKPPVIVSTARVYKGIDSCRITARPDNDQLVSNLADRDMSGVYKNCINVLENYTLSAYPEVRELKKKIAAMDMVELTLMSGSGPTVFGLFDKADPAKNACEKLRKLGYEAYWCKTAE